MAVDRAAAELALGAAPRRAPVLAMVERRDEEGEHKEGGAGAAPPGEKRDRGVLRNLLM